MQRCNSVKCWIDPSSLSSWNWGIYLSYMSMLGIALGKPGMLDISRGTNYVATQIIIELAQTIQIN